MKPLVKTTDEAKLLIVGVLEGSTTTGFDIDSIYKTAARGWCVLEFIRCVTVDPWASDPNRYWPQGSMKMRRLWEVAMRLDGRLYWITWRDARDHFSVLRILEVSALGARLDRRDMNYDDFRSWYRGLNDDPARDDPRCSACGKVFETGDGKWARCLRCDLAQPLEGTHDPDHRRVPA